MKQLLVLSLLFLCRAIDAQPYLGIYTTGSDSAEKQTKELENLIGKESPCASKILSSKYLGEDFAKNISKAVVDDKLREKLQKDKIAVLVLAKLNKKMENAYVLSLRVLPVAKDQKESKLSLEKEPLFSMKSSGTKYLDQGKVPGSVREEFQNQGRPLPKDAAVKVVKENDEWSLSAKGMEREYRLEKSKKKLKVYQQYASYQYIQKRVAEFLKSTETVSLVQGQLVDKPVVDKPVVDKPVVDKPVVDKPVVDKPVVDKPVVDKPVVDKPVVDKPVVDKPVVDKPVVDKPVVGWFGEKIPDGMIRHPRVMGYYIATKDESIMLYVPEGEFYCENSGENRALPGYYIDKYEVTNAQYCEFLNQIPGKVRGEGGELYLDLSVLGLEGSDKVGLESCIDIYKPSCGIELEVDPGYFRPKAGAENYPVVKVSWQGVCAYAKWAGKMLPSEAQWAKACQGGVDIPNFMKDSGELFANPQPNRPYPWGKDGPNDRFCRANYKDAGHDWPVAVDTYEGLGDSPYGCSQMLGNVWEWCDEKYATDKGDEDRVRVCRGGSWGTEMSDLDCSIRCGVPCEQKNNDLGFRCVVNME